MRKLGKRHGISINIEWQMANSESSFDLESMNLPSCCISDTSESFTLLSSFIALDKFYKRIKLLVQLVQAFRIICWRLGGL